MRWNKRGESILKGSRNEIMRSFVLALLAGTVGLGQQPVERRPNIAEGTAAAVNGPVVGATKIYVHVMLVETHQFVPGLKCSNFRVYDGNIEQKIEQCGENTPAQYELMIHTKQEMTKPNITVYLVDNNGRPLRMQDEKHKPVKYEISIDNSRDSGKKLFQSGLWHPNISEDNKAASLDDTFSFIQLTLQYQTTGGHVGAKTNGCILETSRDLASHRSIDFSKVDPLSVAVDGTTVYFSGVNNGPYGSDCQQSTRCDESNQRPVAELTSFSLDGEEIARRLARALMHASLLCGGKKAISPF
jgi:hypothetical protein